MRSSKTWLGWGAALLSAALVAVLFPPFNAAALAWFALVPLLAALWSLTGKRRGWRGFGLAWLAGGISSGIQFSWLCEVSVVGMVALSVYLGLYWGLFGAYAATWGNPWTPRAGEPARAPHPTLDSLANAACLGAVWAGIECLRGWAFTGFGWNGLGVAFHNTAAMAQAADLLGVPGLSLLLVFFQAVLLQAARRVWQSARDGKRRPRWDFVIAAAVVMAVLAYGLLAIQRERHRDAIRVGALLVQLNIPQDAATMSWEDLEIHRAYEDDTLAAFETLDRESERKLQGALDKSDEGSISLRRPDWVVWPESAMRGQILRAADGQWAAWRNILDSIDTVRQAGAFTLIFGTAERESVADGKGNLLPKDGGAIYNSLAAATPGNGMQTYPKHHLVIFGETIPFIDSLPFLKAIYEQQAGAAFPGSLTPGKSLEPLALPAAGTTVGVIPSVCFEDTVPRLERKFVRPGPQVIVNVTNDGWFRQSAAAAQHFANARFRAIELRRPMLRSGNSGVSAAVDTTGSTRDPDDPKRNQVIADDKGSTFVRKSMPVALNVPRHPATTLYIIVGDWGITGLAVAALAVSHIRSRRRGTVP